MDRCERRLFTRPVDGEVDDVDADPETDGLPGALRAEPELPAHRPEVPRGRDLPLELDRPALDQLAVGAGPASTARSAVGVVCGAGREVRLPGSHSGGSSRSWPGAGSKRCAGVTGAAQLERLVRPIGM